MKPIIALMTFTGLTLSLYGCVSAPKIINTPNATYQNQIEGQWVDSRGIVSSFNKGIFETRTSDTNEKLAEGNYVNRSPQIIDIEMRSLLRGTVSRVNCALIGNGAQLTCTTADNNRFTLNRRNTASTISASQTR